MYKIAIYLLLHATCRLPHNANTSLINKPNCVIQLSIEVYEIGERNKVVVINNTRDCQELNDEDRRNFTKHMVVHAVASQSYFILMVHWIRSTLKLQLR